MAATAELSDAEKDFLSPYLPSQRNGDASSPFVTLTFAQSLDGMIALAPRVQTALSGEKSKAMTHYLRLKHDAILIGVGTAMADDPGLNSRYPGATIDDQPRPIIVDPDQRWDLATSKLLRLARAKEGKMPWIIHGSCKDGYNCDWKFGERRIHVCSKEASCYPDGNHHSGEHDIPWPRILFDLMHDGINSVMIEGGASVIQQLLQVPDLVNSSIVTIAPVWLGADGVRAAPPTNTNTNGQPIRASQMQETAWRQFGADGVVCGKPET